MLPLKPTDIVRHARVSGRATGVLVAALTMMALAGSALAQQATVTLDPAPESPAHDVGAAPQEGTATVASIARELAQALNPAGGSSVSGMVRVTTPASQPGAAVLRIEAGGLRAGAHYTAHLHAGIPSRPSASFSLIGSAEADASGNLLLQATQVAVSGSDVMMDLSADLLFDGAHFVDLHGSDRTVVAISSLPRLEPTGIGAVDASLAAVQRGDVNGLLGLTLLSELPCGPLTPEGFALVPECLEGETEGTIVPVLPAAACEGYWARDPRPVLESFVQHAGAPFAIVRGPEVLPSDTFWPAAEYLVVFAPREGSFVAGLALYITENHIVAVEAGCNPPEQLVRYDGRPLPVIWQPAGAEAPALPQPAGPGAVPE